MTKAQSTLPALLVRGVTPSTTDARLRRRLLGGLVSSTALNLFIMPVLYLQFGR